MITKEEFEKAVEHCNHTTLCKGCPLCDKPQECGVYLTEYIKNEPALSANSTSSEVVSKDTDNIHLDDSTLLDICQEGLEEITKIYNNDYQVGYANAVIGIVKKLRDGDGNEH